MIVLLPNCGFLSETSRMLAIAGALRARGAACTLASHGGPYEHLLGAEGRDWTRLAPTMGAARSRAFLDGVLSFGRGDSPLYDDAFLRAAIDEEVAYLRAVGARLAVIGFNLTTYLASRVAGVPLAASHGGVFLPPVLERGLCPAPVNPPRPGMARLPRGVQRWLANHVPFWLRGPARDLNRMARELGVPGLPSMMAMMCADLTLVTEIPEVLGIPADELEAWRPRGRAVWPTTRMRYVGPLFARLDLPVPDRLEAFLAGDDPVVYLAPTSVHEPLLRALVAAVAATGARVVVGATIHQVADLEGERVQVHGVLPSHAIMPRVAAAVIMGGQGSVQTAMTSGTPFVGMPYHGEQELNVALAERRGMAIRLSPDAASGEAMTRAVRRLLDEPAFREAAAATRALYAGADGADGAARAILEYLAAEPATRSSAPARAGVTAAR